MGAMAGNQRRRAGRVLACGAMAIAGMACVTPMSSQAQSAVVPIPGQTNAEPVPSYLGAPAVPQSISMTPVPQNASIARNGTALVHDDSYMSDTIPWGAPLGTSPAVLSNYLQADCGSIGFDKASHVVGVCMGPSSSYVYLLDPASLAVISSLEIPPAYLLQGQSPASGYFYINQYNRIVVPTSTNEVWVIGETGTGNSTTLTKLGSLDLSSVIPAGDSLVTVFPQSGGALWFASRQGIVGTVDSSRTIHTYLLPVGEKITNSFAVDPAGGVFIASDHAMYRFDSLSDGSISMAWRQTYDRGTRIKPGQFAQGTGTTPTLVGTKYVTITDNADPYMHVLVYKRATTISGSRLLCSVPVFGAYTGADEVSEVSTDTSIIVTNNYGYTPDAVTNGGTTSPGIARIDIQGGTGCKVVWANNSISIPNAVTKLSLSNGLIYAYTKAQGPDTTDAWYLTAMSFSTGQVVWQQLAGTGANYDSLYAGIASSPDGKYAYIGVTGGIVSFRDSTTATPAATPAPTATATSAPSPTQTSPPTSTSTAIPATSTSTAVSSDTATPIPSDTAAPVPSDTATPVPTDPATAAPTNTALPAPTSTPGGIGTHGTHA